MVPSRARRLRFWSRIHCLVAAGLICLPVFAETPWAGSPHEGARPGVAPVPTLAPRPMAFDPRRRYPQYDNGVWAVDARGNLVATDATLSSYLPPGVNRSSFQSATVYLMHDNKLIRHYFLGLVFELKGGGVRFAVTGVLKDPEGAYELKVMQNVFYDGAPLENHTDRFFSPVRIRDYDRVISGALTTEQGKSCRLATGIKNAVGYVVTPFTLGLSKPCYQGAKAAYSAFSNASR